MKGSGRRVLRWLILHSPLRGDYQEVEREVQDDIEASVRYLAANLSRAHPHMH